jgi:anti-sigma regulatory factor (Ser/Thr protein kinase)
LKVAIAEAVLKVIESGNRYPSNLPVSIRLRVSYRTLTMQSTDQENVSIPDELTVNISAQEPFQGWGFFLLERRVDDIQIVGDAAQHSIELFLYRE